MRTFFDCIPCSIRQVLDSMRMITDDEAMHERVLRELLGMWQRVDMQASPPATAQQVHRLVRQLTGVPDPYLEVKNRYNQFALGLYPEMHERVENSPDPFETAVRLAIAGNIIDFGVNSNVEQGMVHETIMRSLTEPLDREALERFRQAVDRGEGHPVPRRQHRRDRLRPAARRADAAGEADLRGPRRSDSQRRPDGGRPESRA